MLNIGQLANAVQKNCHISDARHAGDFTLCIFLLKMREYYRWENEIPFTGVLPKDDIGTWLQEREQMWNNLETSPFEPLPLGDSISDPFDSQLINRELIPQGFIYSGGYGRFCKPHFFLGDLVRQETRAGFTIYISSCEYARDLVAPPAMLQGREIYVRQESVRRFLWEKIEESRWNKKNAAMERALACYDFDDDVEAALDRMTANETDTMIWHELGEGLAGDILGEDWQTMLSKLARSKAEIMARAVRDLVADCLSTLPRLAEGGNDAALHFYFATFSGMRKYLAPEMMQTYQQWVESGRMELIKQLAAEGAVRWVATARTLQSLYRIHGSDAVSEIEKLLEPTSSTDAKRNDK